jgi:cell pole-organizing protein PopZ
MSEPDRPLSVQGVLEGFRHRALADEALRWGLRAAIGVCGWGIALLVASRIWPIASALAAWGAGAAAIAAAAGVGWMRNRPDLGRVARTTDARLGLAERLASAHAVAVAAASEPGAGEPGELPARLEADALAHSAGRHPGEAYPIRRHRPSALIAGGSALALVVLAFLPNPMDAIVAQRRADQATVKDITSQVRKQEEAVRAAGGNHPSDQQKAIDAALNDALKKLASASSPKDALQDLAALSDKLQSLDNPSTSGQVAGASSAGAALGATTAGKSLGGSLSAGQLATSAQQARQLADALKDLTPDQRRQLAQALGDAANSAGDSPLGNALSQAAGALSAGDAGGAQQSLNKVSGALSDLAQQQAGEQSLAQAQAAVQQALAQANQAAGQGQASQNQAQGQGQGSGSGSGSGNGSGSGSGNGSGSGSGGGSGSGSGNGSGSGSGSGGGSGAVGTAASPNEKVYVPKTGAAPGTQPLPAGPLGPGQTVPQTGYRSVIGSYAHVELNALDQTVLPPSERDLVQQYFASLDEQGPTP